MQCVVANLNADDKKNSHIGQNYGVTGFPTFKFFSKNSKEPEDFDGERTEAGIVAYLNEKCGTNRAVGGGLNDQVSSVLNPLNSYPDTSYGINLVLCLYRQVAMWRWIPWPKNSILLLQAPGTPCTRKHRD